MNINGISSSAAAMPYGGKSTGNTELTQLEAKLENSKKEVNELKKKLSTGGSKEVKEQIAKKEQEIIELEKRIQEIKSKEKSQNKVADQKQNKVDNTNAEEAQQAKSLGNVSSGNNLNHVGNVIDEYI